MIESVVLPSYGLCIYYMMICFVESRYNYDVLRCRFFRVPRFCFIRRRFVTKNIITYTFYTSVRFSLPLYIYMCVMGLSQSDKLDLGARFRKSSFRRKVIFSFSGIYIYNCLYLCYILIG